MAFVDCIPHPLPSSHPLIGLSNSIEPGKKLKKIYSTGFFFSATTSSWKPVSTSCMTNTSKVEWMYRVGVLMVVPGMPPRVKNCTQQPGHSWPEKIHNRTFFFPASIRFSGSGNSGNYMNAGPHDMVKEKRQWNCHQKE
jgi:hypothetical protein